MTATWTTRYRRMLERLRDARLAAGLTQTEVADALGRPQSFVSKTESGERRLDVIELEDFARLYGRAVGEFLEGLLAGGASVAAERRARFGARGRRRKGA